MKNLYSFSDNPLNTEKFVNYGLKKGPKATIGAVEATKPKASETQVAATMDRLRIMIKHLDKKKNNPKFKKYWEKALKINTKLKGAIEKANNDYTKVSLVTLNKINREIIKNPKLNLYRRQLMRRMLVESAKAVLSKGKRRGDISGFKDLFSLMNDGESRTETVKGNFKFTALKRGNKMTIKYRGTTASFTINAKGKDLKWEMKGKKIAKPRTKPSIALDGLDINKKKKKKIGIPDKLYYSFAITKTKKGSTGEWARLSKSVAPVVAKKGPAKKLKTMAQLKAIAEKAKETAQLKIVKAIFDAAPSQLKGVNLGKLKKLSVKLTPGNHISVPFKKPAYTFKMSADKKYLRITKKGRKTEHTTRPTNTVIYLSIPDNYKTVHPAKPTFDKAITFGPDPLNPKILVIKKKPKKAPVVAKAEKPKKGSVAALIMKAATPEKQRQLRAKLRAYGKEVSAEILKVYKTLSNNHTIRLAFLRAIPGSNIKDAPAKVKILNKYRSRLKGIMDKIKGDQGENIPKYVNQLADAYKLIPKKLDWITAEEKVMVKVTDPKVKDMVIASNVLNRDFKQAPEAKPAVVAKKPTVSPKETVTAKPTLKKWTSKTRTDLKTLRRAFHGDEMYEFSKKAFKSAEKAGEVSDKFDDYYKQLKKPDLKFSIAADITTKLKRDTKIMMSHSAFNDLDEKYQKSIKNLASLKYPNPSTHEELAIVKKEKAKAA
ncbi:hypothetical protein ACFL10_01735 [Patescibacteria group bacterium]